MKLKSFLLSLMACLVISGCNMPGPGRAELNRLREENRLLRKENAELKERLGVIERAISPQFLLETPERRLPEVEVPSAAEPPFIKEVTLGVFTDSSNWDDVPGDDGIVVFVSVKDSSGDSVKWPGAMEFELFDLRRKEVPRVAHWEMDADEVAEAWVKLPPSFHFRLPWRTQPPEKGTLILCVRFTSQEGEVFEAMKRVSVK